MLRFLASLGCCSLQATRAGQAHSQRTGAQISSIACIVPQAKERARDQLARRYRSRGLDEEEILHCLYSISDNNVSMRCGWLLSNSLVCMRMPKPALATAHGASR